MPQNGVGSMRGSSKGRLPLKVLFHCRSSSTTGHLPPKVVFHLRSSSLKVVFHLRSSSTKGFLPAEVVFQRLSSTYHNTLVHLIFVRAVNIPNLSFLPAVHDAWCMMHDGGRRPSVEDNHWWKMTFGGRHPLVEDNLQWKTTFSGSRPLVDPCMLPIPLCSIFRCVSISRTHTVSHSLTHSLSHPVRFSLFELFLTTLHCDWHIASSNNP